MSLFGKTATYIDGLTSPADHLQFQMDHDPTPAQEAEQEAADVANYVEQMRGRGWTMREVSYDKHNQAHWHEYVIDQSGRKHITAQGSFYAGSGNTQPPTAIVKSNVVDGEIVKEDENVWFARYLGSG